MNKLVYTEFPTHETLMRWLSTPHRLIPEKTNRDFCRTVNFHDKTVTYYEAD